MKPRRILIFSFAYYPRFVGGAEVAVKEITDRIAISEAAFEMITIGDGRGVTTEMIGNIRVHRVFKDIGFLSKLLFPFEAYFKANSLYRKQAFDATWSVMANRAGFAALFFKWMHPKIPLILTLQEGDPLDYPKNRAGIAYPLFKYIFRCADRITAISTFLADWAKEMGANAPIEIVPNAVDQALFRAEIAHDDIEALKGKLGKKDSDIFLVTASRLVYKNAVGDIIDALQYLPTNVKLLILGAGDLEGKLKEQAVKLKLNSAVESGLDPEIAAKVKDIGVSGSNRSASSGSAGSNAHKAFSDSNARVLFTGFIPHADLPKYLKVSDIFVRPSLSEGLGNSFLEAMAAGIPVIATPVGGIPDFLKDGETGLFCEVSNPRSIAQKVTKLMRDAESRDYIVKNARKMVEEKYGWEKIADRMEKIFIGSISD